MKVIKHDLGSHFNKIEIVPMGDTHVGSPEMNEKKIRETVEYVRVTPNAYVVMTGDAIDNAIKTSISDIYTATMQPEAQIEKLLELFNPIKDKILAIQAGNHSMRSYRLTGIDIIKNFAYRMGIDDYYTAGNFMLFVSFGLPFPTRPNRRHTFSLYSTHGSTGGKTVGGKLGGLEKMAGVIDADIYLHAHVHTPATFKLNFFRSNSRTKTVQEVTKLFVNSNAWLDFGGYGEVKGYRPATISKVRIKLEGVGDKKYATCEL